MDNINTEPGLVFLFDEAQLTNRPSSLGQVVANLEQSSAILESLDLTLAVALLDHTIAEVRRHMAA